MHTIGGRALAVLALVLLLASCGKEQLVEPTATAPLSVQKDLGTPVVPEPSDPQFGSQRDGKPTVDPETDGSGISDDGDDLSDTERNRKKK